MTAEKEVPQLLGTTCDHETLQHPKDLGRFRQPYEEKMLPRLKQRRPTDLRAVINADTFPNFEQPKYQPTTAATQLPQHYHSSPSHVATQVRSDNNPSVSSRTREQPTQFLVPVASHANSSKQASNTLGADHYFHEKHATIILPCVSPAADDLILNTFQSAAVSHRYFSCSIATGWIETFKRCSSDDYATGSNRVCGKIIAFRERKKTRVDELEKRVEILTEERDHYRGLYYQLKESRDIKHSISLPSLTLAMS
ncbi:predicted protein [Histoplasma mississippiense (nom. inval.)]|uniref:predicted protein n=1 Tax=Ajellomyces capsulatus (strain NAm1 / WU24) TaxID=2059318 RepID=UPI000157C899|nr:predicted protein [Histoplasma mississippiense (nom. inval.)]EDN09625.1 predicted protein [Histoplasma mississippiense (nom. inval.)]